MKKKIVVIVAIILMIATIIAIAFISGSRDDDSKKTSDKQTSETEKQSDDEKLEEESTKENETSDVIENETESEDYSDIVSDVQAAFAAALDYVVEDEELAPEQMVSNAILKKTEIIVNSANETICNVTVKYPDAAKLLTEAEASLPEEATEKEIDEMMKNLAEAIENNDVEMIEKTLETQLIEKDGIWNIQWTNELYDAVTGGLYSIE